ncbi:MAG: hypothetical protein QM737_23865 [Ferruginibacter sp.]
MAASSCSTAPHKAALTPFSSAAARSTARATSTSLARATIHETDVRWPGSFGSAYLYHLVPRVILFREEHRPRVFVPKVDFIKRAKAVDARSRSAAAVPYALLTNMALFDFDRERGGFCASFGTPGLHAIRTSGRTPASPMPSRQHRPRDPASRCRNAEALARTDYG